jgi:hypothetical protein
MWNNTDFVEQYARDRRHDYLAAVEHDALIAACGRPLALTRRAARPLGHALFKLGAWLLRYGKAESPATLSVYRPSARSIKLN